MYNRAHRETGLVLTTTPQEVGPGSYLRTEDRSAPVHGYAPFGSTAARAYYDKGVNGPGPGDYQPPQDEGRAPRAVGAQAGGQPFKSRVPRFTNSTGSAPAPTPGPADYRIPSSISTGRRSLLAQPSRRTSAAGGAASPRAHGGTAEPGPRAHNPPSIPTHAQSYGYEESTTGGLVMQRAPAGVGHSGRSGSDSVGPGAYDPRTPLANTAPAFARRAPRKTIFAALAEHGNDTPGPGTYAPRSAFASSADSALGGRGARASSTFASSTKLAYQTAVDPETITPAPNAYQDATHSTLRARPPPPASLQFFGSTQRRLPDPAGPNAAQPAPGPGSYSLGSSLRVAEGPAAAGFNQTSLRFAGDVELARKAVLPGPGAYSAADSFADAARAKPTSRKAKGGFGTGQSRFPRDKLGADGAAPLAHGAAAQLAALGGMPGESAAARASHAYGHGSFEPDPRTIQAAAARGGPSPAFSSAVPRFGQRADSAGEARRGGGGADATVGVGMSAASLSGATGRRRKAADATPTPSSYKVPSANLWDRAEQRRPPRKSVGSFGSSGHTAGALAGGGESLGPGPGAYEPRSLDQFRKQRAMGGSFISSERRDGKRSVFGNIELTPGPGAYNGDVALNPLVKRSFNITLGGLEAL